MLWTDHEHQWQRLAERLRELLPELLTLGEHVPAERTGPTIWIKCMLARTLDEAAWPATTAPNLYLPRISRLDLRAIETCPRALQPCPASVAALVAFWWAGLLNDDQRIQPTWHKKAALTRLI
ncbi:MAG: hypothetical protein VBE63_10405 [Lamprobacter sp.]|uniref:hypothetical protein n=1 Tax=Lamprobacter sp. TaxID=3100796 RepID=UPI002B25BBE2|nr:hypothetical protein [Lamprobacter sp.]MEA3640344.1 hypothetical protein [Lamprobacter sp.]